MSLKDIPRPTLLKIVAGAAVGLFVLDSFVIEPAFHAWGEQSDRIAALGKKVQRGRSLVEREANIRARWAEMQRANMPGDDSAAGGEILDALNRWNIASHVRLQSVTPSQQSHDDLGYDAFEYRVAATGNQIELGRFLYELETDGLPINLEECEIATRDAKGQALTLTARFSFARLAADAAAGTGTTNPATNPAGRAAR